MANLAVSEKHYKVLACEAPCRLGDCSRHNATEVHAHTDRGRERHIRFTLIVSVIQSRG